MEFTLLLVWEKEVQVLNKLVCYLLCNFPKLTSQLFFLHVIKFVVSSNLVL